jgi:hypothetical protein
MAKRKLRHVEPPAINFLIMAKINLLGKLTLAERTEFATKYRDWVRYTRPAQAIIKLESGVKIKVLALDTIELTEE